MSLIRKHGAVLQAWACLDLVLLVDCLIRSRHIRQRSVELSEIARTVYFGWVKPHKSSPIFFSSNVAGILLDNAVFSLSTALFVPEIFAIKVWSSEVVWNCAKFSFCPAKMFGVRAPKSSTQIFMPASRHTTWKSFVRLFPLTLKWLPHAEF